jgi:hypothetical protein
MVESLHCANCGAPLNLRTGQTLAACGYCNSTLRVAPGGTAQPAVNRMAEVPPEVVDEVKRLLVLGNQPKAVEYYAKQTGLTEAEATPAVEALRRTVGYAPPLNWLGIGLLILYTLIGGAAAVFGITQFGAGRGLLGAVLIFIGLSWILINWLALGRGLRAFWLTHRGTPAEAVILKRWTIKTLKAPREPQPVELVRFLLEVRPAGRAPYETEANGMVRHQSVSRTQPGCRMKLQYDPNDPTKVVLIGPVDTPNAS